MILYEKQNSSLKQFISCNNVTNLNFVEHLHNSFELIYVEEGELQACSEQKKAAISKNQLVLFLPNQIHSYKTSNYSKCWLWIFSTDFIDTFCGVIKNKTQLTLSFELDDKNIYERLINIEKLDIFEKKSLLYYICSEFMKKIKLCEKNSKNSGPVYEMIEYVQANFNKEISLRSMAKQLGYDYYYLSRCFSKNIGVNFNSFLNEYRIHHAQYLLRNHFDMKVSEVAFSSGFENLRSFNRAFLENTKMTPSSFRRNHSE